MWSPSGTDISGVEKIISWNDKETINKSFLEGLTILTPTTTDARDNDDFIKGVAAKKGKIRCVLKLIEPASWLYREGIADIGEPGSTPNAPGVFLIVSKGYYTVHEVSDHVIRIQFKSKSGKLNKAVLEEADKKGIYIETQQGKPPSTFKNLSGLWNFQISHIDQESEKRIILCRLLNPGKFLEEMVNRLKMFNKSGMLLDDVHRMIEMMEAGKWRPEIAEELGLSKTTILKYQHELGLL